MNRHYQSLFVRKEIRWIVTRIIMAIVDLATVLAAYFLAYHIRFFSSHYLEIFPSPVAPPPFSVYLFAAPLVLFMWLLALLGKDCYIRIQLPALDEFLRTVQVAFFGTVLSMSALFLYRDFSYSRLVFLNSGVIGFLFLYLQRELTKISYLTWNKISGNTPKVIVLGEGHLSFMLKNILEKHGRQALTYKELTNIDEIKKTISQSGVSQVLVADSKFGHELTMAVADFCEEQRIEFRVLPDILELRMGEVVIDDSLGLPTFKLKSLSLHGVSFFVKRMFDVALSSGLLGVFFMPLLLIVALIKLTSAGPVFYLHDRVGFRGQIFRFIKFRTMIENAEDMIEDLQVQSDRQGPVFKMKKDPRVTWIGKYLRRYSLDELPQLINVLLGDMSLVGPRPQVLREAKVNDDWANKRLNVLPGITGLWQVSGRAELTYQEMIDLDIYYIEHWSPGLDLKIMLKTLPAVFAGQGAY